MNQIEIIKKENFDIFSPYLKVNSIINNNHHHIIYCDSANYKDLSLSFACVGGVVIDNIKKEIVAEFFAPLKTKDILGQPINTGFEKIMVQSSIDIGAILKLDNFTILNNNSDIIKLYQSQKQNKNISFKLITEEENIATQICSFAINKYKETNSRKLDKNKQYYSLFSNFSDNKIIFVSYQKKVLGDSNRGNFKYHYMAIDSNLNLIQKLTLDQQKVLAGIELAIKVLEDNNIQNTNFIFPKNIVDLIRNNLGNDSKNEVIEKFLNLMITSKNLGIELNNSFYEKIHNVFRSKPMKSLDI